MIAVQPVQPGSRPDFWLILGLVVVLSASMFLQVKFVHPVRTARWRGLSLPVALVWTVLAGWAAWAEFAQPALVTWGLIVTTLYLGLVGIVQQLLPEQR